ncbi:unnamed protein product [marine sediment metagenome]|uniref:HTH cro/C1-type domain-containing protein n=1 Tax=marine sediment metagenome TaxID=412755 RepID=X1TZA5_9ZZZZ
MLREIVGQHPLFIKYTRDWLHSVTGYSKGMLSRVATGKIPLSRSFIDRVCYRLNRSEEALFLPDDTPTQCLVPGGCATSALGQWLEDECAKQHLSLRQAAAKTGLSHATIADIKSGSHPDPGTIRKLVETCGGDGPRQKLAFEDRLLVYAGYRTERPEEELDEPLAKLLDTMKKFNRREVEVVTRFADFLAEVKASQKERETDCKGEPE